MKILHFIILFFIHTENVKLQSCERLVSEVKRYGKLLESKTPLSSDAIAKAEYYTYDDSGFAIIYFKRDGNLYGTTPYIYCDISSQRWKAFTDGGAYGSWGQSFNKYIKSYQCDC